MMSHYLSFENPIQISIYMYEEFVEKKTTILERLLKMLNNKASEDDSCCLKKFPILIIWF